MNKQNSKNINNVKIAVGYLSHMLVTLLMMAGVSYFANCMILEQEWDETLYVMYVVGIFFFLALYSLLACKKLYCWFRTEVILIFCFLVSALLLFLAEDYVNAPLWLVGGIAAAALVDRNVGIIYVFYFIYHAIYLQGDAVSGLLFHLVCATFVCILVPKMKTWISMLYMMIFTGALVIALSIIINQFVWNPSVLMDAFTVLCAYVICIFITMLFVTLLKTRAEINEETVTGQQEEKEEPVNYEYLDLLAQETAESEMQERMDVKPKEERNWSVLEVVKEWEDLTKYCNEKAELLVELRVQKKAAYAHAVLAGKLAYQAAENVGLNAALTKATALYEAVGKLHNDNADEVTALLTERQFPDTLLRSVKDLMEKNISSKEIALVIMADDVISNYTVIRHVKKVALSPERIVDKTLDKKMFQGEYNASGMTLAEYAGIRNAFVLFLKEQDEKIS